MYILVYHTSYIPIYYLKMQSEKLLNFQIIFFFLFYILLNLNISEGEVYLYIQKKCNTIYLSLYPYNVMGIINIDLFNPRIYI